MTSSVSMCSKQSRLWCLRIGMLISIFTILMTMIVQIWNYYFTLMNDMDTMIQDSPKLAAIVEICETKIVYQWNIDCKKITDAIAPAPNHSYWQCATAPNTYIDYRGTGHLLSNSTFFKIEHTACLKAMIWSLPW